MLFENFKSWQSNEDRKQSIFKHIINIYDKTSPILKVSEIIYLVLLTDEDVLVTSCGQHDHVTMATY